MDIDLAALRALDREKDISLRSWSRRSSRPCWSPTTAPTGANRTPGSSSTARPGTSSVWAHEVDEEGVARPGVRRHPDGFGRIAATTARQVIVQRLRDLEDEQVLGEFAGREGDIVAGVIQQGRDPRNVMVDLGRSRAAARVRAGPGERYEHGERLRCYVLSVRKGLRGPQIGAVPDPPRPGPQALRPGGARDRRRPGRDRRPGPRVRPPDQDRGAHDGPGLNAKGSCIGPMGQRVRAVMAELHGEKIDIVDYSDDPADFVASALSPAKVTSVDRRRRRRPVGPGHRARLPALAGDRQGRPERPPGRQAHRVADRHPLRHRPGGRPAARRAPLTQTRRRGP